MFNSFMSPIEGKLIEIANVPDSVFAQKIMGDGFAIDPASGDVIAPVNGVVTSFMDTRHAVGITSDEGMEVLIHVGIDTVKLEGEGFTAFVAQEDAVVAGQLLLRFDLEAIRAKVPSLISPVVFTNLPQGTKIVVQEGQNVKKGQTGFLRSE